MQQVWGFSFPNMVNYQQLIPAGFLQEASHLHTKTLKVSSSLHPQPISYFPFPLKHLKVTAKVPSHVSCSGPVGGTSSTVPLVKSVKVTLEGKRRTDLLGSEGSILDHQLGGGREGIFFCILLEKKIWMWRTEHYIRSSLTFADDYLSSCKTTKGSANLIILRAQAS